MGLRLLKRVLIVSIIVVAVLLTLSPVVLAASGTTGTVQIRVVNGTRGGGSVAGLDLILRGQQNGKDLPEAKGRTDADGYFVFQEVATSADCVYQVVVTYLSIDYGSDPFRFAAAENAKSIRLAVYETTNNLDISIAMAHTVVYPGEDSVLVKEYLLFANDTDRTYIGPAGAGPGKRETLRFWLPSDATNLQLTYGLDQESTQKTGDGFIDTLPVYPGGREVMYSYSVKIKDGRFNFVRKVLYPSVRYDFLVQGSVVEETSAKLTRAESLNINNIVLDDYQAANLAAGETIQVKLSGLTATGGTASANRPPYLWIMVGIGALAVGLVAVFLFRRKPRPAAIPAGNTRREELLADLAFLDDDFEAGNISEEAYQKLRATLKADLVSLMQDSDTETGSP